MIIANEYENFIRPNLIFMGQEGWYPAEWANIFEEAIYTGLKFLKVIFFMLGEKKGEKAVL